MLFLKRLFVDKEETSMSIEEAKEAIKARKNVCAAISEKEGYHPTSFIVKHVIPRRWHRYCVALA